MFNNSDDRKCLGRVILKTCARIVCLLVLVVCVGMLLLFGGMMLHYCCGGRFENRVASLKDLVDYILFSQTGRKSWRFSPGYFDFEHTNKVYTVEFCPRLARKHDIYMRCGNSAFYGGDRTFDGVVLQISICHVRTGVLHEKVVRTGFENYGYKCLLVPIYTFSTADLPWKYNDRLRIEIIPLALCGSTKELAMKMNKIELKVDEGVPFN